MASDASELVPITDVKIILPYTEHYTSADLAAAEEGVHLKSGYKPIT
jgi:hypothetical protein